MKLADDLGLVFLPLLTSFAFALVGLLGAVINVDDLEELEKELQELKVELADLLVIIEKEEQLISS